MCWSPLGLWRLIKKLYARPTMCGPVLPAIVPTEATAMRQLLPFYLLQSFRARTNRMTGPSSLTTWERPLFKGVKEDMRYSQLLRDGLDDDRILRILDGQEDVPDIDDTSETF
ncbi:uncharacterized protein ARMOST_04166 [Armillaria ostoyae]|uniref:Uncharacterized protein n=1 Tax=Armillaria ostoyae TaxID=47428 RepID=A0A284QWN1_ARMOS|nr:uncharacterized protein ARMOST_04166 [Armillaria ostoyae]